jgi:tRNA (cmo5U34)-methyltransferase
MSANPEGIYRGRWDPSSYEKSPMTINAHFQELQERLATSMPRRKISRVLDLGIGTGETSRRILARYPETTLVGIDSSSSMLAAAEARLCNDQVTLVEQKLEDPLPHGPFDLVVSALTVHHLSSSDKAELFSKVFSVLKPNGRFILADLFLVPTAPARRGQLLRSRFGRVARALVRPSELAGLLRLVTRRIFRIAPSAQRDHVDRPDTLADVSDWLRVPGFDVRCPWVDGELAVVVADKPGLVASAS